MDAILFCFSFQVALNVDEHAYALIFGWNTFVALALQSILTIVVADKRGLNLDIRVQVRYKYQCITVLFEDIDAYICL